MTSLFVPLFALPFGAQLEGLLRGDTLPDPTPSPTEVLRPGLSKWDVTPGLIGFLAMFCVVLAAVAVWFSMTGKLRKIQHDERLQASAQEARDAGAAQGNPFVEPGDAPSSGTAGDAPSSDGPKPPESDPETGS